MNNEEQAGRARRLLELHHAPEILILPNVWDPLGARLLEHLGYPAVASASAAVAFSLGYDDGQRIRFDAMVDAVRRMASAVRVPFSADIEGGYADAPEDVAANVRRVLEAGAVGINLEDGLLDGSLRPVDQQVERIRAVRAAAGKAGIPLVINARVDVYIEAIPGTPAERLAETVRRAAAYREAGADCIYPILLDDLEALETLRSETGAPLNVFAHAGAPPVAALEDAGIARVSVGPGFLRAAVTAMHAVASSLLEKGGYDSFARDTLTSDEIRPFLDPGRMP